MHPALMGAMAARMPQPVHRPLRTRLALLLAMALPLAACGWAGGSGPLRIIAIGDLHRQPDPLTPRLSAADALLLDATARGLVAHDGEGQIEAGLAERWTVIDDGRSYIFRIRRTRWADGRRMTAAQIAPRLFERMRSPALPPGLRGEFAAVESVRAMTARVIEVRLTRAQPNLLDLLAQPMMAINDRGGWGPLRAQRVAGSRAAHLHRIALADAAAETADEAAVALLWGQNGSGAVAQFEAGEAAVLMGGRFQHWPYLAAADIDQARIERDPVNGLFGLAVVADDGLLANNLGRDAVAMAIDRAAIAERLAVPQWAMRATVLPATVTRAARLPDPIYPAWIDLGRPQRLAQARRIVADLGGDAGAPPRLRIALPDGPGAAILFAVLRRDLAAIGVTAQRVPLGAAADLRLIDEVAPSNDPGWYLRRVGCGRGLSCDPSGTELIDAFMTATDTEGRSTAFAAADERLTRHGGFIALGQPLRWSLVSGGNPAFRPNPRGWHSITRLLPEPD